MALWFCLCLPLHLLLKPLTGRSPVPRWFLRGAGWLAGARVRIEGRPAGPHTLLIVNHVSWMDILVLGGATGCAFVSKDNLGHGFIHWLADQQNTLYVERERVKGALDQAQALGRLLDQPQPVALFPEGTVGPGDQLLPFRSTLFAAVEYAGREVAIRPVALDYGDQARDIAWFQVPALDNAKAVLGRRGVIPVTVRLLDPLPPGLDRKALARAARAALDQALGFTDASTSPIGARQ